MHVSCCLEIRREILQAVSHVIPFHCLKSHGLKYRQKKKKKPHINCNVAGTSESTRAKGFLAKMPKRSHPKVFIARWTLEAFFQCVNSASERTLEVFLQCMNSASERWWQSVDCCINVLKTEQSQGSVFFYAEIDLQQEYLYENVNSISNSSNSEWTWRTEQMSCRTKAIQ